MNIRPETARVLMSEALKGHLPEPDEDGDYDQFSAMAGNAVYVVIDRRLSGQSTPLSGLLRSVLFDAEPELEVMIELSEALAVVKAENMSIEGFELHHGNDTTVTVPGPFTLKAAMIQDIDVMQQSCIIALQLQRKKT